MPVCRRCGEYYNEICTCREYLVDQDYSRAKDGSAYEESGTAWGRTPQKAAENWAEQDDRHGDYTIVGGQDVLLRVKMDEEDPGREFVVSGESLPVYYAKACT